jgi:hypothetical protein
MTTVHAMTATQLTVRNIKFTLGWRII